MSAQLRQCRQGLAKALTLGPATISEPEPVLNVSCPLPTNHPEMLHDLCHVSLTSHNHPVLTQHRADCRQGSKHGLEGLTVSGPEPEHQDLPARMATKCHQCSNHHPAAITSCTSSCFIPEESSSMEALDELTAKLEFENKLNQVCNRFSLNVNMQPARGDNTGSADSGVEEGAADGEEDEDYVRFVDTVLAMEQDYELFVY
ncbi:hypothetical protein AMELA_G00003340 [Ameiurus melas]|uniref:Uncharacterized protein n=1 Tax=Ameiurus melas TaxID=219545 RepID=A0A7J6BEL5_AMEME|nr:hypothetical protein AMELA_G00003340 [Ameiurus melas]